MQPRCDAVSRSLFFLLYSAIVVSGCGNVCRVVAEPSESESRAPGEHIPLAFAGYDGRYPVVSADIGGTICRLMLDTGAAHGLSLTGEALEHVPVSYTGNTVRYRDAYGGEHRAREFAVPCLKLGPIDFSHVLGLEADVGPYALDGAVGLGLLCRFDALIDYAGGELTLFEPGSCITSPDEEGWNRYRYRRDLAVEIAFPCIGGEHEMLLDSGCGCILVSQGSELGRRLRSALDDEAAEIIYDGITGGAYRSYEIGQVFLENYDLGPARVAIGEMAPYIPNGLVGYDFFANNTVYISFKSKEIWLKPAHTDPCSTAVPFFGRGLDARHASQ